MGARYVWYRVRHELEMRMGLLKKRHPTHFPSITKIGLNEWRDLAFHFWPPAKETICYQRTQDSTLKTEAKRILGGELLFFSAEWKCLGLSYDWITNPTNGYRYSIKSHWSEIPDLSPETGDIKYVWEKSRFSYLLTLIRYDYHFNVDLSEFIFSEIDSWIEHNPINRGPNWRCSQEISLRIFNWYFALSYYRNSTSLTEERWNRIQEVIFASLHHVFNHINFSRIAVRNNHAITETLLLAVSNILFPFIEETKKWSTSGRKWFEKEIAYQIYNDGTFLQFSMNYHRVVIQLLTLGITITEKASLPFSKHVYDRAYKSLEFLYQCLQDESGWLPNYGSNDGALFFPLSTSDYRDFRPQLNSLHKLLTGENLFNELSNKEEILWWNFVDNNKNFLPVKKFYGIKEYSIGGYVIIRDERTFTFARCGSHKDRPAQADNLHIDIWVDGKNIARDSGSYKYNTTKEELDYFMGSASHNTVMVGNQSQMLKGSRFIWYYWTQKVFSKVVEDDNSFMFEGQIKAFRFLNEKAEHYRRIVKLKGQFKWIIFDRLYHLEGEKKSQLWHIDDFDIQFRAIEKGRVLPHASILSFNSNYYGVKEEGKATSFQFKDEIETQLTYQP